MIVLVGKNSYRRFKVRIDGRDKNGMSNASRQITVLADSIEEVYDAILEALNKPPYTSLPKIEVLGGGGEMKEPNPYCGICAGTGQEVVNGKTLTCMCTEENDVLHYPNVSQLKKALAEEPQRAEPPKGCGQGSHIEGEGCADCREVMAGSRPSAPAPSGDRARARRVTTMKDEKTYEQWLDDLRKTATERGYSQTCKFHADDWRGYFDDGYTPDEALKEDESYA